MEITFEKPPEPKSTLKAEWENIREKLIANSGQWARIRSYKDRGTAHQVSDRINRSMGAWRGHRWESVYRTVDGVAWLYVRHLGADDGGAA